jgi:chemotaxis protein CheC
MASDFERFGETQLDVLREIGNIGAGHAATALSNLLGKPVNMDMPKVKLIPFDEIAEQVGGLEAVVVAIFLRIQGEIAGNLFLLMPVESAKQLLREMTYVESSDGMYFNEMEVSALSEIGNILAGSYLTSLADFIQVMLSPTVPGFAVDMAGAILTYGLLSFGDAGDTALLIETSFLNGSNRFEGHLFMIPDPESLEKIFAALGVPDA